MIRAATGPLRHGESLLRHGIGKGLRFDPSGGNPGYALGTSEPEEQALLARHLRDGDVFYDIGANVGFFAVLGAHLVGKRGHVYAFEPFPESAAATRHNAAINGFDHLTVIEAAVADRAGRGSFMLKGSAVEFCLDRSQMAAAAAGNASTIPVEVVAVDELLVAGRLRPPNLVMIDVEGTELDVLEGMAHTIERYRPAIVCEVHWLGERFKQASETLAARANYRIRRLDGRTLSADVERYHVVMLPS